MSEAIPAQPKYSIGTVVNYRDHHGRPQAGEVRWIEAKWLPRTGESSPTIIYALHHPTYHNNRFYAGDSDISGIAK